MKRIIFCALLGLMLCNLAQAQVSIQASIPAVGLVQKNQLWNLLLVNGSNGSYECRVQLVLRDRQTGQEIMTATTGQFTLIPGAKQLNSTLLNPIQYNYLGGQGTNAMQGLLPVGTYTACYQVSSTSIKAELLAEECVPFDAEPLSPPMLMFPADSAVLENSPTQFSWIPPTPAGMFDRLQYDVLITEIREGQKAEQAIQENLPFYNDGNVISNFLNYPAAAQHFEKEKWYAWQVVARDDRSYAGKSEVWVFKVQATKPGQEFTNHTYISLGDEANSTQGVYDVTGDSLSVKYYSFEKTDTVTIELKNSDRQVIQTLQKTIVYGDNFFTIKLKGFFSKGQRYTISLKRKNGEKVEGYFRKN